jgi:hypothetical protein
VYILEGIMQGHQAFPRLAGGMFVSTGLMLCALKVWGHSLEGVWFCFFVFNISRLAFGLRHHLVDGPLAPGKLRKLAAAEAAAAGGDGGVGAATPVLVRAKGALLTRTRPLSSFNHLPHAYTAPFQLPHPRFVLSLPPVSAVSVQQVRATAAAAAHLYVHA